MTVDFLRCAARKALWCISFSPFFIQISSLGSPLTQAPSSTVNNLFSSRREALQGNEGIVGPFAGLPAHGGYRVQISGTWIRLLAFDDKVVILFRSPRASLSASVALFGVLYSLARWQGVYRFRIGKQGLNRCTLIMARCAASAPASEAGEEMERGLLF